MTEDCHMWKRIQWFQENEQGVVWGEKGKKKKENPKQYICVKNKLKIRKRKKSQQNGYIEILDLTSIDENIFSKSLAKALRSTSLFVAPISTKADAIDSYSLVDIDAKKTSIAAHVLGDMRPTIPVN